jgi:hypothetical protein
LIVNYFYFMSISCLYFFLTAMYIGTELFL